MFIVAALYHFTRFDDPAALKPPLAKLCCGLGVTGTLLLAPEGVNGTIAGTHSIWRYPRGPEVFGRPLDLNERGQAQVEVDRLRALSWWLLRRGDKIPLQ